MPAPKWQFRVKHLLLLTTVVVALLVFSRPFEQHAYWIGGYDLTVTLVGDLGAVRRRAVLGGQDLASGHGEDLLE